MFAPAVPLNERRCIKYRALRRKIMGRGISLCYGNPTLQPDKISERIYDIARVVFKVSPGKIAAGELRAAVSAFIHGNTSWLYRTGGLKRAR